MCRGIFIFALSIITRARMKKYNLFLFFLPLLLVLASCHDDREDVTRSALVVTGSATDVGLISSTLHAWVNPDMLPSDTVTYAAGIEYSLDASFSVSLEWLPASQPGRHLSYTLTCVPATTYYYRSFLRTASGTEYGEVMSFRTRSMSNISRTGQEVETLYTRAFVCMDVYEELLDTVFTAGTYGRRTNKEVYHDVCILYSSDSSLLSPPVGEYPPGVGRVDFSGSPGQFTMVGEDGARKTYSVMLKNLLPNTTYYYRAATRSNEIKRFHAVSYECGEIRSFTTQSASDISSLETGDVRELSYMQVTVNWVGLDAFTRSVSGDASDAGVEYSTDSSGFVTGQFLYSTDGVVADGSGGGYHVSFGGLQCETVYYYRSYARVGDSVLYGRVRSFRTKGGDDFDLSSDWVDLGLSCFWSNRNLGAAYPESTGGYYAWGAVNPGAIKNIPSELDMMRRQVTWDSPGFSICGSPRYDAARVRLGPPCCLPTVNEIKELQERCIWQRGSRRGMSGYLVFGPNGNNLFLPCTGYWQNYGMVIEYANLPFFWSGEGMTVFRYNTPKPNVIEPLYSIDDYRHYYLAGKGIGSGVSNIGVYRGKVAQSYTYLLPIRAVRPKEA